MLAVLWKTPYLLGALAISTSVAWAKWHPRSDHYYLWIASLFLGGTACIIYEGVKWMLMDLINGNLLGNLDYLAATSVVGYITWRLMLRERP